MRYKYATACCNSKTTRQILIVTRKSFCFSYINECILHELILTLSWFFSLFWQNLKLFSFVFTKIISLCCRGTLDCLKWHSACCIMGHFILSLSSSPESFPIIMSTCQNSFFSNLLHLSPYFPQKVSRWVHKVLHIKRLISIFISFLKSLIK